MQTLALWPLGERLCCYTCGGIAVVEPSGDPVADHDLWPEMDCPMTRGCPGKLVPESLD